MAVAQNHAPWRKLNKWGQMDLKPGGHSDTTGRGTRGTPLGGSVLSRCPGWCVFISGHVSRAHVPHVPIGLFQRVR
jgi:hypothetical protein